jgi:hypothetical protein
MVAMSARKLLDGSSFGPEAMKAIGQAFDDAWKTIEGNFGTDAHEVDAARLRLATAILSIANDDSRDVEALKRSALEAMALSYRQKPANEPQQV